LRPGKASSSVSGDPSLCRDVIFRAPFIFHFNLSTFPPACKLRLDPSEMPLLAH
jgi:hypothetical protein